MQKKESNFDSSLKILAKSSFIVFISIILSKILGYAYRIIVARSYGPEIYGMLGLSLVIFGWFNVLSLMGWENGLLRYFSIYRGKKEPKKISYILKFSLKFLPLAGFFIGILLFFLSDFIAEKIFLNSELSVFLKIFSLMIPLTSFKAIFFSLMHAYGKVGAVLFASRILDNLVKVSSIILLTIFGINLINVPISYISAIVITLLFAYLFCRINFKNFFKMKISKNKRIIRNIFSYSWPLVFFSVSMSLLHQEDLFLIGIFKTVKDVGFYNAAVPLSMLFFIPLSLFSFMFFPLITQQYAKKDNGAVTQLSKQTGKWVYMITLPFLSLFIIFPGFFIKLFFGSEYLIAINALRFLSIGAVFASISDISKMLLSMDGRSKLILKDILFILLFNTALNLILIPIYGINGAAIATMVSFILLSFIFMYQSWKYIGVVPLRKKMINITIITAILSIILLLVRRAIEVNIFNMIILGLLFLGIYAVLLFLTGCLDKNDRFIFGLIKRKLSAGKKLKSIKLQDEGKDL